MFIGWPSNFDKESQSEVDLRKTEILNSSASGVSWVLDFVLTVFSEGESFSMFSFVLVIDRDSSASFIKMCKMVVQQVLFVRFQCLTRKGNGCIAL